jgi:ketosteroid isomerase-like protein
VTSNAQRAAVLEQFLRGAVAGDRAAVSAHCTEDVMAWTPERAISSRDELLAELGRRENTFSFSDSGAEADIMPLDVGGEFACAEWSVTLTHTGKLDLADGRVLEPTGARVRVHGVTVAEFSGDRICALRQYWDEHGALEEVAAATGVSPAQPG